MTSYFDYLTKAADIYEKLLDTNRLVQEGVTPSEALRRQHGGIFIAARPPTEISDRVAEVSDKIARIIPAWTYSRSTVHTSMPTTNQIFGFKEDDEAMTAVLALVRRNMSMQPRIAYFGYRVTADAVILAGIPDENFYTASSQIISASKNHLTEINRKRLAKSEEEIVLKLGFGPHITVNRFVEKACGKSVQTLLDIVRTTPAPGTASITSVDVGYWITDLAANPPVRIWHVAESFPF